MGIFGWGGQSKEELKEVIVKNENLITQLRDEKIEAQISESRAQSGFNAQKEADRANHEVEVAQLERKIEGLEEDFNSKLSIAIKKDVTEREKSFSNAVVENRKAVRAEFGTELDTAKKAVASLTTESAKNKGLYDGALLVIASLQNQNKTLVDLNASLVEALPTVSATITTPNPSVVVGSGNKS